MIWSIITLYVLTCASCSTVTSAVFLALPQQTKYCQTKITAVQVLIKSKNMNGGVNKYSVNVLKVYKQSTKKKLKIKSVVSVKDDCGSIKELREDKQYFLTGTVKRKELRITLCDSIIQQGKPTIRQQQNFNGDYDKNCNCEVKYCTPQEECKPTKDLCTVTYYAFRCFDLYSICKRIDGVCTWNNPEDEPDFDPYCNVIFSAIRTHLHIELK